MREEDTREYWDKIWDLGRHRLHEHVILDGSDGEEEFDRELSQSTAGRTVLDEGCGAADFTLRVARQARHVTGTDVSTTALARAKRHLSRTKLTNVDFRLANAARLPLATNSFEVVYSRRGPGSDSIRTLSEAYRVLKVRGTFMEITIGERDKQNLARIFGRGQMLQVKGQVSASKKEMLKRVGFTKVSTRDYLATEVFHGMPDLLVRLRSAPIIPAFDPRKDRIFLNRIRKECMTNRGIETPVHRVVLIAHK